MSPRIAHAPGPKGSQLQTQLYVNRRREHLDAALVGEFPELATAGITWRSPLAEDDYAEYYDSAFLELLGLARLAPLLTDFWPESGPRWDALATVETDAGSGVLLVEGKSYPRELLGKGCAASPLSQMLIEAAIAHTQEWLGLTPFPAPWCGPLYQTANRLAHLYFFRVIAGVPAWLAHLLFVDDPHRPTTAEQWEKAMAGASMELGLPRAVPGAGHVMLPAGTLEELVSERAA
jgi:hypothetical protein